MFLVKKLIANFVMPVPIAVLLVVAGGVLLLRRRRIGGWVAGAGVMVVFLSAWAPVGDALLAPLEKRHAPVLDARQYSGIAAVVVLGTGYRQRADLPITSQLNAAAVVRIAEGIRLYRQLPEARLVLTGGAADEGREIAHGYAEAARALGVPEQDMILLDSPRDTGEEALAVRSSLGEQPRFLLVTSASHMPRAMQLFHNAGLSPIAAPTRHRIVSEDPGFQYWVPAAKHLRKTERALYEYMGMVSVWLLNEGEVGE